MDTTFLTIGLAFGVAVATMLVVLTGHSSADDDGPFGAFALGGTALYGVFGAYLLLDPSQHLKGLNNLASYSWLVVLLMPVLFEEEYRSTKNGLLAGTLGCMIGAVGTKAAEHYKPGPQKDLHTANIWLLILSALLGVAFLIVSLRDAKKRVDASVTSAPRVLESPIDCQADPEHMRLHHGLDSTTRTAAPAPDTGSKPSLRKDL